MLKFPSITHRYFSFLPFMVSGLLLSQTALAGERIEFEVAQSNVKETITVFLQGDQARIITSANAQQALLFDARAKQLKVLNHQQKIVTTLDQATLTQLASVAQSMGEIARTQGGVLGDLFKTFGLDNALGSTPDIEVKITPKSQTISGQACQMHKVYKEAVLVTELCVAETLNLEASEAKTMMALVSFAQLLAQKGQIILEQFDLPIPLLPAQNLTGLPIYVKSVKDETTAVLSGLKNLEIKAQQFSVPNGYTQSTFGL